MAKAAENRQILRSWIAARRGGGLDSGVPAEEPDNPKSSPPRDEAWLRRTAAVVSGPASRPASAANGVDEGWRARTAGLIASEPKPTAAPTVGKSDAQWLERASKILSLNRRPDAAAPSPARSEADPSLAAELEEARLRAAQAEELALELTTQRDALERARQREAELAAELAAAREKIAAAARLEVELQAQRAAAEALQSREAELLAEIAAARARGQRAGLLERELANHRDALQRAQEHKNELTTQLDHLQRQTALLAEKEVESEELNRELARQREALVAVQEREAELARELADARARGARVDELAREVAAQRDALAATQQQEADLRAELTAAQERAAALARAERELEEQRLALETTRRREADLQLRHEEVLARAQALEAVERELADQRAALEASRAHETELERRVAEAHARAQAAEQTERELEAEREAAEAARIREADLRRELESTTLRLARAALAEEELGRHREELAAARRREEELREQLAAATAKPAEDAEPATYREALAAAEAREADLRAQLEAADRGRREQEERARAAEARAARVFAEAAETITTKRNAVLSPMEPKAGEENRTEIRFAVSLGVPLLGWTSDMQRIFDYWPLDLSPRGMRLRIEAVEDADAVKQAPLDLCLPFRVEGRVLNRGEVQWVERNPDGLLCGVRLTHAEDIEYPVFFDFAEDGTIVQQGIKLTGELAKDFLYRIVDDAVFAKRAMILYLGHLTPLLARLARVNRSKLAELKRTSLGLTEDRIVSHIKVLNELSTKIHALDSLESCRSFLGDFRRTILPEIDEFSLRQLDQSDEAARYLNSIRLSERKLALNYNSAVLLAEGLVAPG